MMTRKHTFGGSALDRRLFDFETIIDPVEAAPAEPAPAEPAAVEPPAEPAAPSAPAFDLTDPQTQEQLREFLAQEQAQYQPQEPVYEQPTDEFADIAEAFEMLGIPADRFAQFMQQALAPALGPLTEAAESYRTEEAIRQVDHTLDGLAGQYPDLLGAGIDSLSELTGEDGAAMFDPAEIRDVNRDTVISVAHALQAAAQINGGRLDDTAAVGQAAKILADRDAQVGRAAVERYKRTLGSIGTAPRDGQTAGAAVHRLNPRSGPDGYKDVEQAWVERHGVAS